MGRAPPHVPGRNFSTDLASHCLVESDTIGQALRLTLLGIGIGFAAAFALTRGMSSVLFGITATDPPTYAGVVTILALSSVLAAWVPARRASRVDPMRVLRWE